MYEVLEHPKLNLKDFTEWAKTKPSDEEYEYVSIQNCPIAQYCRYNDIEFIAVGGTKVFSGGISYEIPEDLAAVVMRSRTFGELTEACYKVLEG